LTKIKPKIKPKVERLPEAEQHKALMMGLTGFRRTTRWAFCWVERHATHVVKEFDNVNEWACLEHGVTWRVKKKQSKE
jgi:hypothetical protein